MNKYLISILVAITAVCSMGQTLRYGSMKSDYLVVTNEQDTTALTALYGSGVVWRASWYTENVDRVSGDLKGSNYAYTIYTVLTGDVARASSDGSNYVTAVRAELTNSIKAVSNLVSAIPAQTNITHNSLLGIGGAGTLHVSASETNLIAGSLQRSGGTMTGDLTMGTNAVSGRRFGNSAGDGVSGIFWNAYGGSAGLGASGSGWCAYGDGAGAAASGDNWTAYGLSSGYAAVGDNWGAYGERSGQLTIHTNSHAFGRYAGRTARGNNRMYLDVYAANPAYPADGATNDTLFMDSDGKLYLGGGAGRAENPSAGGVLRGPWQGTGMTNVPIAGVSGLTDALAGKLGTNATPGSIGAVSNTPAGIAAAGGVTNIPSIGVPISTLTTGATVTVTPTVGRKVYAVTASTPITLTNDLSQLGANCTTNYEWEVWVNYTVTNALSTVWDSRIEWAQTPDLTVTGQYKFAFSTACGTKIQARQTYPTVLAWSTAPMAASKLISTASATAIIGNPSLSLTTETTNSVGFIPLQNKFQFVRVSARAIWTTNSIVMQVPNNIQIGGAGGAVAYSYYTNAVNISGISNIGTFRLHVLDSTKRLDGTSVLNASSYSDLGFTILNNQTDTLFLTGINTRELNELEIKAYNAGWRP